MTEREKTEIMAAARMSGARRGDVIVLDDGTRWKLSGRTIQPVPEPQFTPEEMEAEFDRAREAFGAAEEAE